MRMDQAFPSKYLSAGDLEVDNVPHDIPAAIASAGMEDVGSAGKVDNKPVLYFHGKTKGLVLNATNNNTLIDAFGYESDDWIGSTIVLHQGVTDFQGRQVKCIRVQTPIEYLTQHAAKIRAQGRQSGGASAAIAPPDAAPPAAAPPPPPPPPPPAAPAPVPVPAGAPAAAAIPPGSPGHIPMEEQDIPF